MLSADRTISQTIRCSRSAATLAILTAPAGIGTGEDRHRSRTTRGMLKEEEERSDLARVFVQFKLQTIGMATDTSYEQLTEKEMQGPRERLGSKPGSNTHVVCIQVRCCFSVLRSQSRLMRKAVLPPTLEQAPIPSPHTTPRYCGAAPPVTRIGRSTRQSWSQQAYTCTAGLGAANATQQHAAKRVSNQQAGCAAPACQPGPHHTGQCNSIHHTRC